MAERLPPAEWTQRPDLAALVAAMGADNVRWVGGAVRDALLGHEVRDVDAATPLEPATVIDRLRTAGIRTVPTGIDHGTVTAVLPGGPVEITTLRRDVSTDGRRATVAFARDWREDAARRDFTINALYAAPDTLEIFDWFGGLADLAAQRVRFIGEARQRIHEDHLRILRYFRFQARFGAELDAEAEEACAALAATLKGLSRERVAGELLNLLGLPDPADTVARMLALGVLPVVLPEVGTTGVEALRRLIANEDAAGIPPNPIRRLAALLPALSPVAEAVAARLRLSKAQRERVTRAAARRADDALQPRALAYREGIDSAIDRLLLTGGNVAPLIDWDVPQLPLRGGEIVARGVAAGPEVARVLRKVESQWIDEGFPTRDRVNRIVDEVLREL
ncbi:CCA tRNA nucleotidyltransferase [Pelagerythrobacter rhizovicinus]|uniref:CCA tRNA nucleotidyltransferase n=1 Tax=Pelagerythrobacter rhizovicinus TaxID=2268576 RepID=A0A4Q2KNE5_9SPHN|nr:CCA tRNA nucleotidyltransferase [Pelagerythrobacter rhizovicinus]RXZ65967.1 CCA tRNA nucleotidyltransferase [Pelagerythrobacter rhizovicinus]